MTLALGVVATLLMLVWALALLPMAAQEVQISANLTAAAQARACAESGLEYVLSELNVPGGAPWQAVALEVDGHRICTFQAAPTTLSPVEVAVTSTSILVEMPQQGTSVASQNFTLDTSTGLWRVKAGTFRGR
jgi:predicted ATP-grasp superfamily ATP-dependent carboligase